MSNGTKGISRPWGDGTPKWARRATADSNDESFTVPTGKVWVPKLMAAQLKTDATAGNRYLTIHITNGTNDVVFAHYTAATVASKDGTLLVSWGASFTPYNTVHVELDGTSATADISLTASYPPMILPAGYVIRVFDFTNPAANADDLVVNLNYVEYDA